MSVTGWWVVMPVPGAVVVDVGAVVGPLVAAQAREGGAGFERWRRGELDLREAEAQYGLAAPDLLDDHLDLLYEVWGAHEKSGPFLAAACRKGCPAAGLAHAVGAERFGALPGWFGNFALGPERVREAFPAVEAAFSLGTGERAAAERRLYEALEEVRPEDADALLDGLVPVWRRARDAGWGLLGAQATPS
ncbi:MULTISPECIES: hypothetical protein [Kitasatospora]|uniref:Uncharacterized protein n=1 Tax=Kitasatospora setae (strain ATCC 33774 / DSM 43861 / JCM 3304 / KCC A-0304 / NBRC 14216 / KM-6054) TaxID=452652 RepID=E4NJS9_KITSK|nr:MULTISPECIES: hypothetical protein [Kitasatospora]BAJ33227.1 hypothetical protein KSE_74720 [Kitasatospora setae KM-6054]